MAETRALPKVPGLNAQEHRQDHKRPSGVELGTRPMPNGFHPPASLPNRLN